MNNKLNIIVQKAKIVNTEEDKAEYKRLALNYLRQLAKDLGLLRGTYDVRFNPGGPAVCGDAILHHDKFYFHINDTGVMWRHCSGRKDYTGEKNLWLIGFGFNFMDDKVVNVIRHYLVNDSHLK